jgi:hypothetical protein
MSWTDMIGYAASATVLATFCMTNMFHLRLLALASNVLFICFGALTHVYPVLLLHMALLPINLGRLLQAQAPGATTRTISPQDRQEDLAVSAGARPKPTPSRGPVEFSAFGTGAARWSARFAGKQPAEAFLRVGGATQSLEMCSHKASSASGSMSATVGN